MIASFEIFEEFLLCEAYGISGKLSKKSKEKFIDLLKHNIVDFKYVKKDGEIRKAKGTLADNIIPKVKGTGAKKPSSILTYYDMEKKGWRSFNDYQFIKVLDATSLKEAEKEEESEDETEEDNNK